jgi:Leu/Phe-tRNA-protein transferase
MEAGFLVMSMNLNQGTEYAPYYILLPKLHLERSALFYENLHIKKSIRRFLDRDYELKFDSDFDFIIDRCVEKHGSDWLTPPLVDCIKKIRQNTIKNQSSLSGGVYPTAFGLYRKGSSGGTPGELVAAEFGVVCGKVYTSYSGFYDEDNAGTVQMILTTRYLQEHGFSFFDMGMPLDYKTELGAVNIGPNEFVRLVRSQENV